MVSLTRAVPQVKGLLDELLGTDAVAGWAECEGHVFRERVLWPGVLVRLLVLMALYALALDGLKVAGVRVSAAAICQARRRLPLGILMRAIRAVMGAGRMSDKADGAWRGMRLVVGDAMTLRASAVLAGRYGRASNGRSRRRGPAQLKLAAVMDLASGMIEPLRLLPGTHREETREPLLSLIETLGAGDVLVADRAYGSYPVVALARGRGAHVLLRLRDDRSAGRTYARALGGDADDRLVEWTKPKSRPAWMAKKTWEGLPEVMRLREVVYRISRKGRRTVTVRLITSLTDPAITREELARIYAMRWEIETCFRQLKGLTGLGRLRATTPKGLEREVYAAVLAYNLVRLAMVRLSGELEEIPVSRISMIQTLRILRLGEEMLAVRINPHRPGRQAPRKLLDHRKRFAPLRPGDRKRARKPVTLS